METSTLSRAETHTICKSRHPFHLQNLLDRQTDIYSQQKVKATSNERFKVLHNCFPHPGVHLNLQMCSDLFRIFTRTILFFIIVM